MNGKTTWVTHIRNVLCENGFEQVWLFGCENVKMFCDEFKNRLCSSFCHGWREHVETSESMSTYRTFKCLFEREAYLTILNVDVFRMALAKFRMGVSQINVHKHRFSQDNDVKKCPFCEDVLETEMHVLLKCSAYDNLREQYLGFTNPVRDIDSIFKEQITVATREGILNLARFIFYAMKIREMHVSTNDIE